MFDDDIASFSVDGHWIFEEEAKMHRLGTLPLLLARIILRVVHCDGNRNGGGNHQSNQNWGRK
jgi:hypothetical protein